MKPPCIILAGGRSSRMGGGDKGLLPLDGKPMLAHVMERIAPQVSALAISGNGDAARFHALGPPVIADTLAGFPGPLAGILASLLWATTHHPGASHVLSVPCDTPFLPPDLVERLSGDLAQSGAEIAVARDSEIVHPVVGLWPLASAERLAGAIHSGVRSVRHWLHTNQTCETVFAAGHLRNINTPAELMAAQSLKRVRLRRSRGCGLSPRATGWRAL